MKKKLTVLCLVGASFACAAQDFGHRYGGRGYVLPACEIISQEIVMAIIDGERRGQVVERTARYQNLRNQIQFEDFNIPRILSDVKQLQMNGGGYPELQAQGLITCNAQSRGQ